MPDKTAGSLSASVEKLSDRFYDFTTGTFPGFCGKVEGRLASIETKMTTIDGRLKKLDGNGGASGGTSNVVGAAFWGKMLPWLLAAVISGAALGGAAMSKGLGS